MSHSPVPNRYSNAAFFRRCGRSGLLLPALSFGLWHNFGESSSPEANRTLLLKAFDLGITHFDLANNYGPPAGFTEQRFGKILREELSAWRDELIVSTKAGYDMWPGPYGAWGSRKHLIASLDQSLKRLGLEYVDVFYSHRPDPNTPLEETMGALDTIVRSGKALYIGLSNYSASQTAQALPILRSLGTPCLIHQPRYNLLERGFEQGLATLLEEEGIGAIAFCPLSQGLLTNRYLEGIPADSRAGKDQRFLKPGDITDQRLDKIRGLDAIAKERGQSLAQMSLAWVLRRPVVCSALIGASKASQLEENVLAVRNLEFSEEELARIDHILAAP